MQTHGPLKTCCAAASEQRIGIRPYNRQCWRPSRAIPPQWSAQHGEQLWPERYRGKRIRRLRSSPVTAVAANLTALARPPRLPTVLEASPRRLIDSLHRKVIWGRAHGAEYRGKEPRYIDMYEVYITMGWGRGPAGPSS